MENFRNSPAAGSMVRAEKLYSSYVPDFFSTDVPATMIPNVICGVTYVSNRRLRVPETIDLLVRVLS